MNPPSPKATARQGRRVVITGLGPITCIGKGVEGFWNGIRAEKTGIRPITCFDVSAFGVRVAGEMSDWNPEEFFTPQRLKRLDRYAQFAVASAKLALDDAGIEYSKEKPQERVGVSFGTALGGVCKAEEQY
ncbi:MAG TPA: beta-ketoacyl synthase N-terminal-like domain-containing protein, partial [Chthoniobacterales bacterium]